VIEGFFPGASGFHRNAEHLLELPLTDVIGQTAGAQRVFTLDRGLWSSCCALLAGMGHRINKAPWLPRPASSGGA